MTNNNPLVSVMMNCYNGELYLREAIDSVYAQTYENWEIILFDNASTDNSAAIATSYDSRLKYFRNDKTVNLGSARNKALEKCKGEYVAILDCDDVWFIQKLEKQMDLFKDDPKIAVVYSNCTVLESNEQLSSKYKRKLFRGMIFDDMLRNHFIPPSPTVIIKKGYIYSIGSFLDYKSALDLDLLLKLAFLYPFDFVEEPLAIYRIHENTLSFNYENISLEVNKIFNYWKKHPGCQTPLKLSLINKSIARRYYIIGVYNFLQDYQSKKARSNFIRSWQISPSLKTIIFFCLSFFNPHWVTQMMFLIKKYTGRGITPR